MSKLMWALLVVVFAGLCLGGGEALAKKGGGGGKPGGGDDSGSSGVPDADVSLLYCQNDGLGIWKGDDAGNIEQISALSGWRPTFGPAGTTKIVLSSNVQGWGVYVADDFAGTGLRKVVSTTVQAYVSGPVWSAGATPNGQTMIAYVDEGADGYQHVYVTTTGGDVTQLTFGSSRSVSGLAWNPVTHDQLAIVGSDNNIYVFDLDTDSNGELYTSNVENVTEGYAVEGIAGSPSFSPDGTEILFSASGDIWVYEFGTFTFTNLTVGTAPRLASHPKVRGDGQIIFSAAGKKDYVLWVMAADGSNIREYGNTKRKHAQLAPSVRP